MCELDQMKNMRREWEIETINEIESHRLVVLKLIQKIKQKKRTRSISIDNQRIQMLDSDWDSHSD